MTAVEKQRNLAVGQRIDDARRKKSWTIQTLAERAGYNERTIRDAIKGEPVREKTLMELCEALDLRFDDVWHPAVDVATAVQSEVAPPEYGAYSRIGAQKYFGHYIAHRRSFVGPHAIRSLYRLYWTEKVPCLRFLEFQKYVAPDGRERDYSQGGKIYISESIGLLHFLTVTDGALRLITLTKLKNNELRGAILAQSDHNVFYQPSISAIYLRKLDPMPDEAELAAKIGPVQTDAPDFPAIDAALREIESEVIFIAKGTPAG